MLKKSSYLVTTSFLLLSPMLSQGAATNEKIAEPVSKPVLTTQEVSSSEKNDKISSPFEPFTGKILGNKVRLRTQPNIEAHIVKEIETGEIFAIVGEDSEYYAIQPPKDMKGYIFRTFVLEGVVEGARVNVRLKPDTEAPVIGQLNSGDKIKGTISPVNNKWLEIDPPSTARFYIAKEYVGRIGNLDLFEKIQSRKNEASHLLNSALLFSQAELHKPFEEIDLESITKNFEKIIHNYADLGGIINKAKETETLIRETYIQKKIAFLESKADRTTASLDNDFYKTPLKGEQKKLSDVSFDTNRALLENKAKNSSKSLAQMVDPSIVSAGASLPLESQTSQEISASTSLQPEVTDKMRIWEPLEELLYQVWVASNGEKSLADYYEEEQMNATMLTGILEPYNRPGVKNRPGDYVLRSDNLPVAFLYSTKVNLQDKVGQKVTVIASPRPKNNFAFPAFYVISIE